jgi:hypothetical protein
LAWGAACQQGVSVIFPQSSQLTSGDVSNICLKKASLIVCLVREATFWINIDPGDNVNAPLGKAVGQSSNAAKHIYAADHGRLAGTRNS